MSDPINESLQAIREDQREIRQSLSEMSKALSKLAVVEERILNTQQSLGRAYNTIEDHEERITALEKTEPEQARVAQWAHHAVWAAACFATGLIVHKLGLLV